jgi:multiple sugar transport system substrate-binding protein
VYEAANPGVTFNAEFTGWDGYWEKLSAMAASRKLPDVLQMGYNNVRQYVKNGLLLDMQPYVDSGVLDLSDCPSSTWSSGYVDGKLVALNLGMNTAAFLINEDMFKKAGIEIPADTWTYQDWRNICDRLIAQKDTLGILYPDQGSMSVDEMIQMIFREKDLWFYDQDGSESFGWDKETGKRIIVAWLERSKEDQDAGRVPPLAVREETETAGVESGLIVKGQAVMGASWSNQVKSISNAAGRQFSLVAYPNNTAKKMQYMKPSQFMSIASNTEHPEEAAEFLSAFTNSIPMNMELKGERGVPIASKVQAALAETYPQGSVDRANFNFVQRIAPIANKYWVPEPKANAAIIKLEKNMVHDVLAGGMSPEAAFETFYAQAQTEFEMSK